MQTTSWDRYPKCWSFNPGRQCMHKCLLHQTRPARYQTRQRPETSKRLYTKKLQFARGSTERSLGKLQTLVMMHI